MKPTDTEPAKEPAKAVTPPDDRGESTGLMEPLLVEEGAAHRAGLTDLAVELAAATAGLRRSLPPGVVTALADLVRAMNCYYSNLIEGHDTHPVDIERALANDYDANPAKRDLQLEAKAHIAVQAWIDEGGLDGRALTAAGITEIHERFGRLVPESLLWAENPATGERVAVIPGALRTRDVKVGRHVAISPGAVPRFLARFEEAYRRTGTTNAILAAASAHHRLLWIHPFMDGNGRVARLMSYAVLREALDTGGLWSVARGLARREADYKAQLIACDLPRRNDLDGRGSLSEEALVAFTRFFLEVCLDQVRFMEGLMEPAALRGRIMGWAEAQTRGGSLPPKASLLLEAVLFRGELPRGDVAALLDTSERTARRVTSALLDMGVFASASTRAPLTLAFPAKLASAWMPGLFPEKPRGSQH